jgi:hypothetical protein
MEVEILFHNIYIGLGGFLVKITGNIIESAPVIVRIKNETNMQINQNEKLKIFNLKINYTKHALDLH